MRILVLGVSGMLGHMVLRCLHADGRYEVSGVARRADLARHFPGDLAERIVRCVDLCDAGEAAALVRAARPDAIVNCVGLVKQLAQAGDPLEAVPVNTLLPLRLARLARDCGARLVHISTDCVFSGQKGAYTEDDLADARDVYGLSKLLGEVQGAHAITLRTSLVGRELDTRNGLVEWFLGQGAEAKGFTRAIFSGVTTHEFAKILADVVLPRPDLNGIYHVASSPISKYDLLGLLASHYGRETRIVPDGNLVLDRSLNAARFAAASGYAPPDWETMVRQMDFPKA